MNHTRILIPRLYCRTLLIILISLGISSNILASEVTDREQVFEEAKGLLRDGKAQSAYELLLSHESAWSGGDAYDYLLGIAALDSKNPGEAIFSLQRLVVRKPAFSGARLELARAYYDVGDIELARLEFDRLLQEDPPTKVRTTVNSYLEAINTRAKSYTSSTQYFFDFGVGYDSNAPAATDDNRFLSFILSPNNLEQSSSFAQVTGGVMWNKPISPEMQLLVNGSLMHRSNPSTHFVDPSNASVGIGLAWRRAQHTANVGTTFTASYLDRKRNKNDYGLNANYGYKVNDTWRINSFFRYGALRFEDALDIQDVGQLMFGIGVDQMSDSSVLKVSLVGTSDDEKASNSNFGNDGYGLQATKTWFYDAGNRFFVNLSTSTTDYDDPFFGFDREDDIYSITAGNTWVKFPSPDWSLTVQINYSEKQSTVDLYEFERWEVGLFLRKVFN